jgi:hypothetical protein
MAKRKIAKEPVDREFRKSLIGQYETITGRDWYEVEALMKAGDISATLIFIGDHVVNAIKASNQSLDDHVAEKLDFTNSHIGDLIQAVKKSAGQ